MRSVLVTISIGVLALAYVFSMSPPLAYPTGVVLKVDSGQSGVSVGTELSSLTALRSVFAYRVCAKFFGHAQAGWYLLDRPESACELAYRTARGDTRLDAQKVTVPEGYTVREISSLLHSELPRSNEGMLFPDTYYFLPGTSPDDVVARMRARYEEVLTPLRPDIATSGHSEREIITMASILEKEARLPETRRMVAGILWKRVALGMPLQVDAVFGYIKDVDTYVPTLDDLKIQSPYNTYLNKGLPPGPINNPGEDAIRAALEPTKSPYLYYLTGKDGTMHYAKTFEEHVANKRFLR